MRRHSRHRHTASRVKACRIVCVCVCVCVYVCKEAGRIVTRPKLQTKNEHKETSVCVNLVSNNNMQHDHRTILANGLTSDGTRKLYTAESCDSPQRRSLVSSPFCWREMPGRTRPKVVPPVRSIMWSLCGLIMYSRWAITRSSSESVTWVADQEEEEGAKRKQDENNTEVSA